MDKLTLLALDTATEACSVALLHQGEKTFLDEVAQRTHTQRILPMIDEILVNSGLRLSQIDGVAFGRGPGSFTGVRISAAVAQGLALAADLPVIRVSNLMAMAQAAYVRYQAENVLAAIDARMNEVYFAQYRRIKVRSDFGEFFEWQTLIDEQVVAPERILPQLSSRESLQVGTGWQAYPLFSANGFKGSEIVLPSARDMLDLALVEWQNKRVVSALDIEPIYLRNEVTWKKLPGRE